MSANTCRASKCLVGDDDDSIDIRGALGAGEPANWDHIHKQSYENFAKILQLLNIITSQLLHETLF